MNDTPDIDVIFSASEIAERIAGLAAEIVMDHRDDVLVVPILKGSFVFAGDLLRALFGAGLSPEVDFIFLSSYGTGTRSRGHVRVLRDVETDTTGKHVLIIDDILESGRTLAFAKRHLAARGAKSVSTCVLLDKPVSRAEDVVADYVGFDCPDEFVVGYGMDLAHRYRELPFVGRLVKR